MDELAKQIRVHCQKLVVELNVSQSSPDAKQIKTLITLSGELHKRLALLEGVSLKELDQTTF